VAFYDAIAGGTDHWTADPKLAEVARVLVKGIKEDLTVDWADHEATESPRSGRRWSVCSAGLVMRRP
jgi:hypothetical protein